jgi:hypothetical protein
MRWKVLSLLLLVAYDDGHAMMYVTLPGDTIYWKFVEPSRVVTRWETATDEKLRERGWLHHGRTLFAYCKAYRERMGRRDADGNGDERDGAENMGEVVASYKELEDRSTQNISRGADFMVERPTFLPVASAWKLHKTREPRTVRLPVHCYILKIRSTASCPMKDPGDNRGPIPASIW